MMRVEDLDEEVRREYARLWHLPDGRLCGILRLLMHWTIHVDIDPTGYADRYCYATRELAERSADAWDGVGDPLYWHRH